ncbi:hypothetical protein WKW79_11950 [Variovorax robiniae]|uniref:Lipoprotein n=1 Tax=Variovorax robiniae TaxID=1836199 RepID=A0ABU8X662_9BURK
MKRIHPAGLALALGGLLTLGGCVAVPVDGSYTTTYPYAYSYGYGVPYAAPWLYVGGAYYGGCCYGRPYGWYGGRYPYYGGRPFYGYGHGYAARPGYGRGYGWAGGSGRGGRGGWRR